jgi:lipopolysaccharide/colanic/teichoic acid biosynthesis glycosyltransferase
MVRGLQAATSSPPDWAPPISRVSSSGIAVWPGGATIGPVRRPSALRRAAIRTRALPSRGVKRAFDIAFASVVSAATAPIVGAAIVAIRIESRGPALFRQRRMGLDGTTFELIKLRGMYVDARERFPALYDYASKTIDDGQPYYFHQENDPRVTRVGRILRRYSIDELPNFWNVLRGDMSVVGPRPEIPELAHLYGPQLERLLSVRPGVTSPAKACGRDSLSFEETLSRELDYVRAPSFSGDLRTIARTVKTVLHAADVC